MKFILGTKQNMTQVFDDEGRVYPATVISAPQNTVTQIKTDESDGYTSVQIAAFDQKKERVAKAQQPKGNFKHFKEFQVEDAGEYKAGQTFDVSVFEPGDKIRVAGLSKGKGFQGVVKRHGFAGGPRSHGNKHSERKPGSIGSTGPQRVFKGTRMAGRMGGTRTTVTNLRVLQADAKTGTLLVSGAVPGRRGTVLEVQTEE